MRCECREITVEEVLQGRQANAPIPEQTMKFCPLHAAAPELLQALKALVYHGDKCQGHRGCSEPVAEFFTVARVAIANAEK